MYVKTSLLSAITLTLCALSAEGTPTKTLTIRKRAIEPTATGQIGVNPVTDLPASKFTSIVGPATDYYDSTSGWKKIGVNTEYLTEIETTVTVDNAPKPTTLKPAITFITAAAAVPAEGIEAGDVNMIMSPKLNDALNSIAQEVTAACAGKKRQACDANLRFAQAAQAEIRPGGRLDFDFDFIEIPTITASDVAAVVSKIPGAAAVLGSIVLAYIVATHANTGGGPPKIAPVHNIPANMAGGKVNNPTPTDSCPPDAPTGDEAPVCPDPDCKGPNDDGPDAKVRLCTEGKWKDCPCLREAKGYIEQIDPQYLLDQQTVIQWIMDNSDDTTPKPWCAHGGSPHSGRIPSEYCQCGEDGALKYNIAENKNDGSQYTPCPYTEQDHPQQTITFQDPPQQTQPPQGPELRPKCNVGDPCKDFEKTKRDFPWLHLGTAMRTGRNFCEQEMNKPITEGVDALTQTFDSLFEKDPKKFLIKVDRVDTGVQKKLDVNDCKTAMNVILNGCDTCSDDVKFGGNLEINGVIFRVNPLRDIPCITC